MAFAIVWSSCISSKKSCEFFTFLAWISWNPCVSYFRTFLRNIRPFANKRIDVWEKETRQTFVYLTSCDFIIQHVCRCTSMVSSAWCSNQIFQFRKISEFNGNGTIKFRCIILIDLSSIYVKISSTTCLALSCFWMCSSIVSWSLATVEWNRNSFV